PFFFQSYRPHPHLHSFPTRRSSDLDSRCNALTRSILFALVFFRRDHAIVHGVGMKHYRDKVEEKETETPTGGCERRQQHEDSNRDRTKHPEKSRKFVSLVNMTQ